jgi:hypothetical protein
MWALLTLQRCATRILSSALLVVVLATMANAYTVVMRSGRRIEIPSKFLVTPRTLTYEVSPGFQVTLHMAAINIAATELANNEAPGALLRRADVGQVPTTEDVLNAQASTARRTITNQDLAATARRRRESERAYEQRLKDLGLPTLAESRARAAAESEVIQRELAENRITREDAESYWRGRASSLRTEMATLDAETAYLRDRIDEMQSSDLNGGSFTTVTTVDPFSYFGNIGGRRYRGRGWRDRNVGPGVFVSPTGAGQLAVPPRYGRRNSRPQLFLQSSPFYNQGVYGIGAPFGWPNSIVSSSYPYYDNSYERSALTIRLNELSAKRAGLNAQWRQLEDEARRAGVAPGWLRP